MSRETLEYLNGNTLIGFTAERGRAWHHRAALQGAEPNHYEGAIPVADVARRLFAWTATARRVAVEVPCGVDDMTHIADDGTPMRWQVQVDRQAITRSDCHHVMGIFKDGYVAHQYQEWLLGSVSTILGDALAIGSAGLLRAGAVAWVSVEVPETITTPEGVAFRPHLLAATSFDGSLSTTFKRVATNVVCDNTMAVGLSEHGQAVRVRHSRYSDLRVVAARKALELVHETADEFADQVTALCRTTVTDAAWAVFLDRAVPLVKDGQPLTGRSLTMATTKRDELGQLWTRDARVEPWKNTGWGVIQALNTWAHHVQGVRGAARAERNMTRAVLGETERADRGAVAMLGEVLLLT